MNTKTKSDFIKLYSDLKPGYYQPLVSGCSYSEKGAFVDLIYRCAHSAHYYSNISGNKAIGPGSIITTLGQLAAQWKWPKSRVNKFLSKLHEFGIINQESDKNSTMITLQDLPP